MTLFLVLISPEVFALDLHKAFEGNTQEDTLTGLYLNLGEVTLGLGLGLVPSTLSKIADLAEPQASTPRARFTAQESQRFYTHAKGWERTRGTRWDNPVDRPKVRLLRGIRGTGYLLLASGAVSAVSRPVLAWLSGQESKNLETGVLPLFQLGKALANSKGE